MCRLLGWASASPTTAEELLEPSEQAGVVELSRFHADGWGVAVTGGESVHRSTRAAAEDPDFLRVLATTGGRTGVLHLRRATTGYPVTEQNTHPFVLDGWAFAHNGTIVDQAGLDSLLSPCFSGRRRGDTDSERYFLAFLQRLEAHGDVAAAMCETVGAVREACGQHGLNALACSPSHLVAVQAAAGADPTRDALVRLMGEEVADRPGISADHLDDYFGLRYRQGVTSLVVASTGLPGTSWHALDPESVLVVDLARGSVECRSLEGGAERWSRSLAGA